MRGQGAAFAEAEQTEQRGARAGGIENLEVHHVAHRVAPFLFVGHVARQEIERRMAAPDGALQRPADGELANGNAAEARVPARLIKPGAVVVMEAISGRAGSAIQFKDWVRNAVRAASRSP